MIDIVLYRFAKKVNSTARPTSSTTQHTFSCLIREGSSIINPYIELQGTTQNIHRYNYCYIPTYNRYYFINDITYSENKWLVSCKIDVLATYQTWLLSSSQYVVRSASESDGQIIDTLYPATTDTSVSTGSLTGGVQTEAYGETGIVINNYFSRTISDGVFIIGVLGENTGGISYYQLSFNQFKTLINQLMQYTPTDMRDYPSTISKSIANPIQYIVNCHWYPWGPSGTNVSELMLGSYRVPNLSCRLLFVQDYKLKFIQNVTIPSHPQKASRGAYMNSPTYSTYMLDFQPFGYINISNNQMTENTNLVLEWYIDYTTGAGSLGIRYSSTNTCLGIHPCQYGIPINLAQTTTDLIGGIGSGAGAIVSAGSALGSFASMDIIGGLKGIWNTITGVKNAAEEFSPNVTTKGVQGSFIQQRPPVLYAVFKTVADDNNAINGRPLCKTRTLSTQSGYVKINNPIVSITGALKQETDLLKFAMMDGFYIES